MPPRLLTLPIILPDNFGISPAIVRSNVVFPRPDVPTIATISPGFISRLNPLTNNNVNYVISA